MPLKTKWGSTNFNKSQHGDLLKMVKADLMEVNKDPTRFKKLLKNSKGEPIEFRDIACESYRLYFNHESLRKFTANSFGPRFRALRDKIGMFFYFIVHCAQDLLAI